MGVTRDDIAYEAYLADQAAEEELKSYQLASLAQGLSNLSILDDALGRLIATAWFAPHRREEASKVLLGRRSGLGTKRSWALPIINRHAGKTGQIECEFDGLLIRFDRPRDIPRLISDLDDLTKYRNRLAHWIYETEPMQDEVILTASAGGSEQRISLTLKSIADSAELAIAAALDVAKLQVFESIEEGERTVEMIPRYLRDEVLFELRPTSGLGGPPPCDPDQEPF